jgi:hypothetical protein
MVHLAAARSRGDKPVLNGECSYEGIFDSCWQDVQRFLFWSHMLSGAAGHTYGAMAIAAMNDRGDPYLPMTRCNSHVWQDAIGWAGSVELGVGKRVLQELRWWQLEPCPHLVQPHAGPTDWFQPYAARLRDGGLVIYFPSVATQEGNDWRGVETLSISGMEDGSHDAIFVDPRNGNKLPPMRLVAEDGRHVLKPTSNPWWVTPTGEDWVMIVRRADT